MVGNFGAPAVPCSQYEDSVCVVEATIAKAMAQLAKAKANAGQPVPSAPAASGLVPSKPATSAAPVTQTAPKVVCY